MVILSWLLKAVPMTMLKKGVAVFCLFFGYAGSLLLQACFL